MAMTVSSAMLTVASTSAYESSYWDPAMNAPMTTFGKNVFIKAPAGSLTSGKVVMLPG